jgi:WD40 repeat protein
MPGRSVSCGTSTVGVGGGSAKKLPGLSWACSRASTRRLSGSSLAQAALGHPDGSISLYELSSARALRRLGPGRVPIHFAFHPDSRQLALAYHEYTQIRDLETGNVCAQFPYPHEEWPFVAWSPDGKTLATGGGDRVVHLWDVASHKETAKLEGFKEGGIIFAFNRAGDLLASSGWDGTLRLWDPRTGQQLFQVRVDIPDRSKNNGTDSG